MCFAIEQAHLLSEHVSLGCIICAWAPVLKYGSLVVHFSSHDFQFSSYIFRFSLFIPRLSILVLRPSIFDSRSSSLDFRFTFPVGVVVWWAGPARSFAHARLPMCM